MTMAPQTADNQSQQAQAIVGLLLAAQQNPENAAIKPENYKNILDGLMN